MGALRIFDVDPRDAEDLTTRLAPGEAGDLYHLQAAPLGELALRFRDEPVEAGSPAVFGLVDDPRLRIDGDRFVSEPATEEAAFSAGTSNTHPCSCVNSRVFSPCLVPG